MAEIQRRFSLLIENLRKEERLKYEIKMEKFIRRSLSNMFITPPLNAQSEPDTYVLGSQESGRRFLFFLVPNFIFCKANCVLFWNFFLFVFFVRAGQGQLEVV